MKTMVLGANGRTGVHLVNQLLEKGLKVKAVIQPTSQIPETWMPTELLTVARLEITRVHTAEMTRQLEDCQAVACCLGHSPFYSKPHFLVSDTARLLSEAATHKNRHYPLKMVFLSIAGYHHPDLDPPRSSIEKWMSGLLRLVFPPLPDHERAADYMINHVGTENPIITWSMVRPDILIQREKISPYSIHPAPIRNPYFNPGKASRINVARFMATLITDEASWHNWAGRMPVIYNNS